MEDIQPFKSSLWEFYITHHWFLHKDKDGHKEPPDGRLSLRRAAACVFADSSKASRSCAHCCAGRTPLLIPDRTQTESSLFSFFFFVHQWGEKKSSFSSECDLRSEPLWLLLTLVSRRTVQPWVRGGPVNRHRSFRAGRHISQTLHRMAHDGDTVAFV